MDNIWQLTVKLRLGDSGETFAMADMRIYRLHPFIQSHKSPSFPIHTFLFRVIHNFYFHYCKCLLFTSLIKSSLQIDIPFSYFLCLCPIFSAHFYSPRQAASTGLPNHKQIGMRSFGLLVTNQSPIAQLAFFYFLFQWLVWTVVFLRPFTLLSRLDAGPSSLSRLH